MGPGEEGQRAQDRSEDGSSDPSFSGEAEGCGREQREREQETVRGSEPGAPRSSSVFRPAIGIGFVEVFDRERLVIERVAELLRDEAEPSPGIAANGF